jgi:hypothetical protein
LTFYFFRKITTKGATHFKMAIASHITLKEVRRT